MELRKAELRTALPRDPQRWLRISDDTLIPEQWSFSAIWDNGLHVELAMAVVDGIPRCRGVACTADDLTPADVRGVPLRECIDAAISEARREKPPGRLRTAVTLWDEEPPPRARPRPRTDELLREAADEYRAALARGEHPIPAVAARLHVASSTASHYVMDARKRRILGPTTQRVAGETASRSKKPQRPRKKGGGKR